MLNAMFSITVASRADLAISSVEQDVSAPTTTCSCCFKPGFFSLFLTLRFARSQASNLSTNSFTWSSECLGSSVSHQAT